MNGAGAEGGGAAVYLARISHRRLVAPLYRFVYTLAYCLLDIDRLDATGRALRFFSHNRFNLWAFHDADHGDGRRGGLRAWAERVLRENGVEEETGRIELLTLPRVLGFAFNPISLWYCHDARGALRAVIAEVNNTFGERHSYVLASAHGTLAYGVPIEKEKCFHVSPFMDMEGQYRFEITPPGARVRVIIREFRRRQPLMVATLAGERRGLSDASILAMVARMPWMTVNVVVAIHWQALKIWLRGGRYHSKPAPPAHEVS